MFEQEYRAEMNRVELSRGRMKKISDAMVEKRSLARPGRRLGRALLVAAAICAVLTASVLALSPGLRERLAQALGRFGPYSQTVAGAAATDQDYEITAVSAVTDQFRLRIYLEVKDLTGERIVDEHNRIWCRVVRKWPSENQIIGEITPSGSCISYDPETHTALFELGLTGYCQSAAQEELELSVLSILPRVYDFEGTQPLSREQIAEETLETITLDNGRTVVAPDQNPAPLAGVDPELAELSSMGFCPDGRLYVLFRLADGADLGESGALTTAFVDGVFPQEEGGAELDGFEFEWAGRTYSGLSFHVGPEDRNRLTFMSGYGRVSLGEVVRGNWVLSFQVENMPSLELTLTGGGDERLPDCLTLSPLGAVLSGDAQVQYRGNSRFAVKMEDGTYFESVQRAAAVVGETGETCLGNWDFAEPLELGQAVAVELGEWYISLRGEDAGTVYPIDQHP